MIDRQKETASNCVSDSTLTRRVLFPALASLALISPHLAAQAGDQAASSDAGNIWWAELRTRLPKQSVDFYAAVLGWTSKIVAQDDTTRPPAAGEQNYTVLSTHDGEVAGVEEIEPEDSAETKPGWLMYVQVDDIDDAIRKVTANGGKVIEPPVEVPGTGRMAEIEDPEGNRLGLVTPKK